MCELLPRRRVAFRLSQPRSVKSTRTGVPPGTCFGKYRKASPLEVVAATAAPVRVGSVPLLARASSRRLLRNTTRPLRASTTLTVGRCEDIVTTCHAARGPPGPTKTTRFAVSRGPAFVGSDTSARAFAIAAFLVATRWVPRFGVNRPEIGDPPRLRIRPCLFTLAWRPLPKTGSPSTDWVHDRWWVPMMST